MRSLSTRTLSVVLLATAALTAGWNPCFAGDPDEFVISRTVLRADDTSDTSLRLSLNTNAPLDGFSLGILPGGPLDLLGAVYIGPPAEFVDLNLLGGGGATLVVDLGGQPLQFGVHAILNLNIDASSLSPGSSAAVEVRGDLGVPAIPIFFLQGVTGFTPASENGQIERAIAPQVGDLGDVLWIPRSSTNDVAVIRATDGSVIGVSPPAGVFDPSAVAVNPDGTAWVASEGSGQVLPYRIVGSTVDEGVPVVVDGSPVALAVDFEQSLWVASHSPSALGKIIQGGGVLFGGSGALGPSISFTGSPIDLACDRAGNVWLSTESPDTLQKFSPSGELVFLIPFTAPVEGIALDRDGFTWLTFPTTDRVERRSTDGALVGEWVFPTGSQLGDIAIRSNGSLVGGREAYVTAIQGSSAGLFRVSLPPLSTPTFFPKTLTIPVGPPPEFSGLAVDGRGAVWAVEPPLGDLYRFDPLLEAFAFFPPIGGDPRFQGDATGYLQADVQHPGDDSSDPLGDLDGDGSRNASEIDLGSSPFDATSTPADLFPEYVEPIFGLACRVTANGDVELTWENGSTGYSGIQIVRVDDGGMETVIDPDLVGSATSFIDVGIPEGRFDYRVRSFVFVMIDTHFSDPVECTIVRGEGEVLLRRSVAVGDVAANLFDITTVPNANTGDPSAIAYYATDGSREQIYALNGEFEVVSLITIPLALTNSGLPIAGIAFDPDGNPGETPPGSIYLARGDEGTQIRIDEISRSGGQLLSTLALTQPTFFQGLPELRGRPGGLAYSRETEYLALVGLTGPIGCDVFAVSKQGGGVIDALNSFPHPQESGVGFTLRGVDIPPGDFYGPSGGTIALLSSALNFNSQEETFEITRYVVSNGIPSAFASTPLVAIEDENTIGGFALRGGGAPSAAVVGATTSNLYLVRDSEPGVAFVRGDCNPTGSVDLGDAMVLLSYLFAGGASSSCLDACDVDDSGDLTLSDVIRLLLFMFNGGPVPPPPSSQCGSDSTEDSISCLEGCE